MSYEYLKGARKVICIGRNYAKHIKELNNPIPKQPFFFLKPTSSIVTPLSSGKYRLSAGSSYSGLNDDGTNPSPIYIPNGVKVHHEIELALVVDKYLSNIKKGEFQPADVYDSISGIALALDLTARNVQDEAKKKGLPWSIGKGFDTFLPISEFIPKDAIKNDRADLQNVFSVSCSVNDTLRQNDSSSLMLNKLHDILQNISTTISLEPGDIVLTGTPAGVGEIHPGDIIKGDLKYHGKELTQFQFKCEQRPGPYTFKET